MSLAGVRSAFRASCRTLPRYCPPTRLLATSYRMASSLPRIAVLEAISKHDPASPSIVLSESGQTFTYGNLLHDVAKARHNLAKVTEGKDLTGQRIAYIIETSYDYVVTYLSILASNAVAVPMAPSFPASELRYIVNQAQAGVLLASEKNAAKAKEVLSSDVEGSPIFHELSKITSTSTSEVTLTERPQQDHAGMMLYTSGTTSRPKGVLLPISALTAQAKSLKQAWEYSPKDRLLHVLPLHHIHGVVNALITPLFAGSTVELAFPFQPDTVWRRFAAPFLSSPGIPAHHKAPITFFTVVPTIYARLLPTFKDLPEDVATAAKEGISPANLRLNISGSAALPTPTKKAWTDLSSGNVLLERYGMTEVGMALSCGLDFADRVDGSVGWPLPGVEARLMDTDTNQLIKEGEELDSDGKERQGEIQLRGATVFREYWNNAEATAKEHVEAEDGKGRWFKTGDVAVRRTVDSAGKNAQKQPWASGPMYFIQGRKSADIIKSGGEKVSALEVEREMLSLEQVSECAVVGVPNPQWGQKVSAVVVLSEVGKTAGKGGKNWSPLQMRQALKERLVNYKVPQDMKVVESIPRNAMGKINKKALVKEIWPDAEA